MKVPIGWLREYIDLNESPEQVAEKLAMLGFPVEHIERRPPIGGVVAGRLTGIVKHPNADRLQVCTVDIGAAQALTIATAATNVAAGQTVPVALIGATLVGLEIAPRKMRGIDSQGMLVSASEIGLPQDWFEDGILQLEADVAPGTDLVALYHLNDAILDIEVTANRVDVMSVVGVARELGAAFGRAVREPVPFSPVAAIDLRDAQAGDLRVTLDSGDCRRYVATRMHGPGPRPSPMWLRVRLALAGQRPINDVVDVTNYVMFEVGQPIHAFDFHALHGSQIVARDARDSDALQTLDGVTRTLDERILVIADAEEPSAIAGVIGGSASEISGDAREIVVESANFNPARVRRTARAIGVRTEASSRHERALSLAMPDFGSTRATALLTALGWTASPALAAGQPYEAPEPIAVTAQAVTALLGFPVLDTDAARALQSLGFRVDAHADAIRATPPPWRSDVSTLADAVEEIARVIGYDRVPAMEPPVFAHAISSAQYDREAAFAGAAAALGYHEAVTFSLQNERVRQTYERASLDVPNTVEVINPLSEDQRWLRFSLLPGLLDIAARYRAQSDLRVFEIGHVFARGSGAPVETAMAALLFVTPGADGADWRDDGFLAAKEDARALLRSLTGRSADAQRATHTELHPGKTAALDVELERVAYAGALNPKLTNAYAIKGRVYAALFALDKIPAYRLPLYEQPSRFPAVERDLALLVAPDVPARDIVHAIRSGGDGVLRGVRVFDEFRGPQIGTEKKSIAVHLVLQRDDATLTDAEAEAHVARILDELNRRIGATLRT